VAVATAMPKADRTPQPTPCGPLRPGHEASAMLHVAGNRMVDSSGNAVTPYGISLVSGPQTRNWAQTERVATAQIDAALRYWHANAVRLQVSETLLFHQPTRGHSYNVAFARTVDRLECRILRGHAIPVLNDTTIFT